MRRAPGSLRWLAGVLLVVLVGGVYGPVWQAGFVDFDDDKYVRDNAYVRAGLEGESLAWAWTTNQASNWHPLTWWSLMVDAELSGPRVEGTPVEREARVFHVTNVVLHAVNAVLLLLILEALLGSLGGSLLVAALFAVHPLHVESVAWISERKDVLSTLFWLGTMAAWVRYARAPGLARYGLVVLALTLGLMAKPMLVSLPLVLLLLDGWPLGRGTRPWWSRQNLGLVWEKVPLGLLAAGSVWVTLQVQASGGAMGSLGALPLTTRLGNAALSVFRYLGKMVWPEGLSAFYPYPESISPVLVTAAVVSVLGISALAVKKARAWPWLLVGWAWYLVTLLPVLGIVQVGSQAMADRYTYVPLIGIYLILAQGGWVLLGRLGLGVRVGWVAGGLLVAALLVPCYRQAAVWTNTGTLFSHALQHTQRNFLAHTNLAVFLQGQGEVPRAEQHLRQALEIQPDYPFANIAYGALLVERAAASPTQAQARSVAQEALQYLERGRAESLGDAKALNIKGVAHALLGDFETARTLLQRALMLAPMDRDIVDNLNRVLQALGQ